MKPQQEPLNPTGGSSGSALAQVIYKIKKLLKHSLFSHPAWLGIVLTLMAVGGGLMSLLLTAAASSTIPTRLMFLAYLQRPLLLLLNLLPSVLLTWLFYFIFGRAWAGFLTGTCVPLTLALVNYYKIRLRGDAFLSSDLRLVSEAGNIVTRYTLDFTTFVLMALFCMVLGLIFAIMFLPLKPGSRKLRVGMSILCLAVSGCLYKGVYTNDNIYGEYTANTDYINIWSDVEVYCSKGFTYSFLHSVKTMFPTPPDGYDKAEAAAVFGQYSDAEIPDDKRVNIMGVMLEAFCDLSEFEALSDEQGISEAYALWHDLQADSVSGQLITNIFAGGTVDSEWGFLTGYSQHEDFRSVTDSYVWYLRSQGYYTEGSHPGYNWFYNRANVNEYLGFNEYSFTENYYGHLIDPVNAPSRSDDVFLPEIVNLLQSALEENENVFSFSVTYQNHGPYAAVDYGERYLSENIELSEESRNILNNYIAGIAITVHEVYNMSLELEAMEEPVVLVLFGDHKPWLGNGNSVYTELGETFDFSTTDGFYSYYATPYLIWANSAAKEMLGTDMQGDGGDFSPCFLMNKVFELCGWEGSAFMQYANELREITPLVHVTGRYIENGSIVTSLSNENQALLEEFLSVQYYREMEYIPAASTQ